MARSVLVTGGNRGIGLAIARRFAADGDAVTVTSRSGDPVDGLAVVRCDVRDAASVDAAFTAVEADQGPVEVLVANAGVTRDTLLALMSEDDFAEVLDTNLVGAYRVAKRAVRGMMKMRRGRLIFISSVVGMYGSAGQANYASSKAGLVGLARSLARELGSRGITSNVVAPGFVDSDMTANLSEERKAAIKTAVPLGRYAAAAEVAAAVAFLAGRTPATSPAPSSRSTAASGWATDSGSAPGASCGEPTSRGGQASRGRPFGSRGPTGQGVNWAGYHGSEAVMGILAGKRILVTGVITDASIAFHVARVAQQEGATVVLTGFGRLSLVERIARRLPSPPPVLELDVTSEDQLASLASRVSEHVDGLDGVLHAIAYANPQEALGGNFLHTRWPDVATAVQVSAYSLQAITMAALPLMGGGGSVVGLDFDASVAWPGYDWMGVAKAALESCARYLARDLGEKRVRVNLVAAGPLRTMAAKSIPGFERFEDMWGTRAPLGWSITDPEPTARACVALLSDWFPATTGEIVHVDGGAHAVGA